MRAAIGSLNAAGALMRGRNPQYRSSVSRAYYATFSAVHAALLRAGQRPRRGWGTWKHADLPQVARSALVARLGHGRCKDIKSRLEAVYKMRVAADYQVGIGVDAETAGRAVSSAAAIVDTVRRVSL